MALESYLVPYQSKTNICFDCQKACGGCSWSELDPVTEKPRFEPVPGWTAEPALVWIGHSAEADESGYVSTYQIIACPEFVPDVKRQSDNMELTLEQLSVLMRKWRKTGEH